MINELLKFMYGGVRQALAPVDLTGASEVRVRLGKPLAVHYGGVIKRIEYRPTASDITGCLDLMSGHSLYAAAHQLKEGYITIRGGHRVGVSGKCVIEEGKIKTIKEPTGLCVRIARAVEGAGEAVSRHIIEGRLIRNTLIISPPGAGKTTMLRDISRLLCGLGFSVSVIDERGEIAGGGFLNVGESADVLDGAPKAQGIMLSIRALSPNAVICDEIGNEYDREAILNAVGAGAAVICSAHGTGVNALKAAPRFAALFESRAFERYITLSARNGAGTVESVLDGELKEVGV